MWNIKHGGGRRVNKIVDAICRFGPDTVVLTEFRENANGGRIRAALTEFGLVHQSPPIAGPAVNTVVVCSRSGFTTGRPLGHLVGHEHRCIHACFAELQVYGLYFPQNNAKGSLFDWLIEETPGRLESPALLVGDFNTGSHHIDEEGATFVHARKFEALLNTGWVDSWRHRHPHAREYTWHSSHGNGFRIDHALASPAVHDRISDVYYSHTERETHVSDHSVMVVDLEELGPH